MTTPRSSLALAVPIAVALATACGGDREPYQPLVATTAEEFFELLPVARCQQLVRCGVFEEPATCAHLLPLKGDGPWTPRALDFGPAWRFALARGTVRFSPGDAALCLASFSRGSCSRWVDALTDTTVCRGVFRGTIPTGQPSSLPHECASRSWGFDPYCNAEQECCSEICSDHNASPPPFPEAEPCASDAACGDRRSCHEGYCMRGLAEGEACEASADCWSQLICRGGRCIQRPPPANECLPSGEFPSVVCDRFGSYCHRGECLPLGGLGAACDVAPCRLDLVCGDEGCAPLPGLGEPCSYLSCGEGLHCVLDSSTSSCQPVAADGDACWAHSQCQSGYCQTGPRATAVCAPPLVCP